MKIEKIIMKGWGGVLIVGGLLWLVFFISGNPIWKELAYSLVVLALGIFSAILLVGLLIICGMTAFDSIKKLSKKISSKK